MGIQEYTGLLQKSLFPLLLLLLGICVVGYGLSNIQRNVVVEQTNAQLTLDAGLARLKQIGARIGQLPGSPVQNLDFRGTFVADDDLAIFADLTEVIQVDFSGTAITDRGLRHLRNLRRLEVLRLNDTVVTDRGLAEFENSPELWMLHLKNTRVALSNVNLSRFPKLRILDARDSPIADAGLLNLSAASALVGLGLRHTKVGDAKLKCLSRLAKLEVLDLSGTGVTDEGAATLCSSSIPGLRALALSDCRFTTKGLNELSGLHIHRLDLSNAKIPLPETLAIGCDRSTPEMFSEKEGLRGDGVG